MPWNPGRREVPGGYIVSSVSNGQSRHLSKHLVMEDLGTTALVSRVDDSMTRTEE